MMTAYGLISLELYRGIKFELSSRKSNRGMKIKHNKSNIFLCKDEAGITLYFSYCQLILRKDQNQQCLSPCLNTNDVPTQSVVYVLSPEDVNL